MTIYLSIGYNESVQQIHRTTGQHHMHICEAVLLQRWIWIVESKSVSWLEVFHSVEQILQGTQRHTEDIWLFIW